MSKITVNPPKQKSMKRSELIFNIFIFALLAVIGVVFALPFVWMIGVSFDEAARTQLPFPPTLFPKTPTLENYSIAFERLNLPLLYANTLIVTVGVVLISVTFSVMAGYALEKIRFKGSKVVLVMCLATMMIPFEATMIPLFMLFNSMKLVNSYWAFYLPAFAYPFGIFLSKQFFQGIPDSLREAAVIDGAGEVRIFGRIFVPLSGTIISTLVILQFLNNWNNLLWPLIILNDSRKYTIQIGLSLFKSSLDHGDGGAAAVYPGITMAGTVMALLPVLVIYLFLQKYIVKSVATSGIKQ